MALGPLKHQAAGNLENVVGDQSQQTDKQNAEDDGVGGQVAILDGVGASVGSLGNMRPEDSLGGRGLRDWTPNPIRA